MEHRPSGLAVGPDGSPYVSDDIRGRIYRIYLSRRPHRRRGQQYRHVRAQQLRLAALLKWLRNPPEGTHPDAGAAALPVPEGATREMAALGQRIYRGQVGRGGVRWLPW